MLPVPAALLLLTSSISGAVELRTEPDAVRPGDPILVTVSGATRFPEGKMGERPLHFYAVQGGFEALTALAVETAPGEARVEVEIIGDNDAGVERLSTTITVEDPQFPARELTVSKAFIEPPAAVKKRIKADQQAFKDAYGQPFSPRAFQGAFERPRDANVTAPFGDRRTFNGKQQSQHYGLDLDGRVGDVIRAAHTGTAILVRDCYASGKTVLLHHGAGLFTAYFHMSKFAVKQGEKVKQGQRLGAVGRTGRVTGPHLHWGVKIDGLYVDPLALLKLPFDAPVLADVVPPKKEPPAELEEPDEATP